MAWSLMVVFVVCSLLVVRGLIVCDVYALLFSRYN